MKVRGRNGKWLRTGNGGTVRVNWVDMVCELYPRVCDRWRGMDAFVIINVVKRRAEVGHHKCVRGENRGRSGRGLVNGKEGANCGKLAANFFFLNIEEAGNVLNHLLVRECQFAACGAVWRRGGHHVWGVTSAVHGRRRA